MWRMGGDVNSHIFTLLFAEDNNTEANDNTVCTTCMIKMVDYDISYLYEICMTLL